MIILTLIVINCWICDFDMGLSVFDYEILSCRYVRGPVFGYSPAEARGALGIDLGAVRLFGYTITCDDYRAFLDYIHLRQVNIGF